MNSIENMATVVSEASQDDSMVVYWEQIPEWDIALETIYRMENNSLTSDDDITTIQCVYEDILEAHGITDSEYTSYSQLEEARRARV